MEQWNKREKQEERKKEEKKEKRKTVGWANGEAKKRIANSSKFTESYNPLTSPLHCKKFKSNHSKDNAFCSLLVFPPHTNGMA